MSRKPEFNPELNPEPVITNLYPEMFFLTKKSLIIFLQIIDKIYSGGFSEENFISDLEELDDNWLSVRRARLRNFLFY